MRGDERGDAPRRTRGPAAHEPSGRNVPGRQREQAIVARGDRGAEQADPQRQVLDEGNRPGDAPAEQPPRDDLGQRQQHHRRDRARRRCRSRPAHADAARPACCRMSDHWLRPGALVRRLAATRWARNASRSLHRQIEDVLRHQRAAHRLRVLAGLVLEGRALGRARHAHDLEAALLHLGDRLIVLLRHVRRAGAGRAVRRAGAAAPGPPAGIWPHARVVMTVAPASGPSLTSSMYGVC